MCEVHALFNHRNAFTPSDPAMHLKSALKDGYIPHKDDLFLIHGPGGVGKSSLISMFLGKQRDFVRVSTAVAEESIHVCPVRDVSTLMYTDQWEPVDIDRQARMVAHTSRKLFNSEDIKIKSKGGLKVVADLHNTTESRPFLAKVLPSLPSISASEDTQHSVSDYKYAPSSISAPVCQVAKLSRKSKFSFSSIISRFKRKKRKKQPQALRPTHKPDTLVKTLKEDPENIEGLLDRIKKELYQFMREPAQELELFLYYSIRVVDSGGQPQFHEVLSIILRAVTGIVSVFKLSESLDVHGEMVFYKDGVQANDSCKSYLTNEQVIRHDLLAIQSVTSHSSREEVPNIAFVGTFLDQQNACPEETPDEKDKRLHSMITDILPEEMQQCVISSGGSLRQVTFRVNTKTPTDKDYQTTGKLKEALMSLSQVKPKNLPLKWCTYEVALRKLMEGLKRQVLSMQECEFLGYKLEFDPPSLKACLHYLRKFHIISFYNCLPNIVFGSCQVILDKITELVTYSLKLKKGNCALLGAERKFHEQGILSEKILKSEACSNHYQQNLFTTNDLLKILKSLLIITEVGTREYLMPCVLEVSDIFPSAPLQKGYTQSSFVLHFSKKSPMLGIYCCIISYLLTEAGWKLLKENEEVVQVARNSTTFELPKNIPGKLIFFDPLSSYFQVVVELPQIVACKCSAALFYEIRNTFFSAVQQAMQTLNYEVKTPELSFLCPEQSSKCSTFLHLAMVDESHEFLTCSKHPSNVFRRLSPYQKMWLHTSKLMHIASVSLLFLHCLSI